ncbi:unnamed protein product [Cyprideis torosa]|uniref:Uncharacterized protein n=1 Tax=Cyprideis torosa TaxID=163714 RepID=A0A7R8WDC0_9CRUS|nr:unnamed protein product [Cyprideis torosa]CAG0888230.1 unnamed protein product [Cyprideis torosa]
MQPTFAQMMAKGYLAESLGASTDSRNHDATQEKHILLAKLALSSPEVFRTGRTTTGTLCELKAPSDPLDVPVQPRKPAQYHLPCDNRGRRRNPCQQPHRLLHLCDTQHVWNAYTPYGLCAFSHRKFTRILTQALLFSSQAKNVRSNQQHAAVQGDEQTILVITLFVSSPIILFVSSPITFFVSSPITLFVSSLITLFVSSPITLFVSSLITLFVSSLITLFVSSLITLFVSSPIKSKYDREA